jgi:YD repeat-containing protein
MSSSNQNGRLRRTLLLGGAALTLAATAAVAAETIRYEYDARGRLVKVVRTDTATNTVLTTTGYQHDKADNRTKRETKAGQ